MSATAPTRSVAFTADGVFDESRLAKPADWAALDDFDEESIIAEMTKRVDETFLTTKEEVQREKLTSDEQKPRTAERATEAVAPAAKLTAGKSPSTGGSSSTAAGGNVGGGCAMCGVIAGKLKRCTACKLVSYCSRECQTSHWTDHKLVCRQAQTRATPAATALKVEDLTQLD